MKTIVLCSRLYIEHNLLKDLGEDFVSLHGDYDVHESSTYIICRVTLGNDTQLLIDEFPKNTNVIDTLNHLQRATYIFDEGTMLANGDKRHQYIEYLKTIIRRTDVDKIVWCCNTCLYKDLWWIYQFRMMLQLKIVKPEFLCNYMEDEKGRAILPTLAFMKRSQLLRSIDTAHALCLSNMLFCTYYTEAVKLIYTHKYGDEQRNSTLQIDMSDAISLAMIYENSSGHFNSGSFVSYAVDQKNMQDIYYQNVWGSFDFVGCEDSLNQQGLIRINKRTQKIFHTKTGENVYGILKEYLPQYVDAKQFVRWRRGLNRVLLGRIEEGEYIQQVRDSICDTIASIKLQ